MHATYVDALAMASPAFTTGQVATAEDLCHDLLSAEPKHAQALHLLGTIALQRGDLDLAIDYFTRYVACNGANASKWNNLGVSQAAAGDYDSAAAAFERALHLCPH